LLGVTACLCVLQAPHAERALIEAAPKLTASEEFLFPIPELKRLRALYFRAEFRDRNAAPWPGSTRPAGSPRG
jgi:hypothetical protein